MASTAGDLRPPTLSEVLRLGLTGVVGVVAYQSLTQAMRVGDVAVVTPFRYSRLLFGLLFAVVLFDERVDGWAVAGMALVVATGLFALLPGRVNSAVEPPVARG